VRGCAYEGGGGGVALDWGGYFGVCLYIYKYHNDIITSVKIQTVSSKIL